MSGEEVAADVIDHTSQYVCRVGENSTCGSTMGRSSAQAPGGGEFSTDLVRTPQGMAWRLWEDKAQHLGPSLRINGN